LAVAVGDVSGKGMPAALLMAISRASFQTAPVQEYSPGQLLAYLDQTIMPYTQTSRQNCALVYLEVEDSCMRVANAGCISPVIKRAGGQVEWVEVGGMPLGVGLGSAAGYQEQAISLNPGDLVILTSDGVVEAKNKVGDIFGFERLEQAVSSGPQASPEAMLDHLQAEIAAFVGDEEPHDDLTIVVLQSN
jgi:serine phosphatase RsbU (regulator of sigma subunit)